jgi:hypothetical protein
MGRAREAVRRAVGVLSTRSVKGRTSGAPTIIPRATWARDQLPPREAPRFGEVKLAFVHHTVGTNDYTPDQSASIVLAVGRYHRNVNGWDDIGYNFLVDKYGQIFEGRAGGVEAAVVGAQAQGYNTLSTGIANLGTYSTIAQTEAGLKALAALIAWKLSVHAVPVQGTVTVVSGGGSLNRYPAGARVELQRISGHRDGDASACPGDGLYAQLPQVRALAASMAGAVPAGALTLAAGHTRLRYLGSTRVSGQLTLADGSQPAGALIELQVLKGGIYRTIGKTRTGAAGAWSSRVKRKRNTTLRARHVDAVGRPVVSPPLSLNVQPIVELDGGNVSVKAGALATFSGVVTPSKPNVVLVVERRGRGGAFKRTGRKVLRTRHGKFRTTLRFSRPGDYRVRAAVKADSQQIGARSAGRQVAVRKAGAGAGGSGSGGATSAASGAQVLPDLRVVR